MHRALHKGATEMRGRWIPLSRARRIVSDHCHFAQATPTGVLYRNINISQLLSARENAAKRLPFSALFVKAFAIAAQEHVAFRRAYVKFPWPHLYEYPASVASVVVEREFEGEDALFLARIKDPASRELIEIAEFIANAKTAPVESIKDFRLALRLAYLPLLLRRAIWWLGLNIGRQRPNYFGTFGVSVLGGDGTSVGFPISPWTVFISYGPISPNGTVEITLGFDHRTMDGAIVSRGFGSLESALNGPIAAELGKL
jgi:hypothetical protein